MTKERYYTPDRDDLLRNEDNTRAVKVTDGGGFWVLSGYHVTHYGSCGFARVSARTMYQVVQSQADADAMVQAYLNKEMV